MDYITKKTEQLIKEFEGLRLKPYICLAGRKTIGWGYQLTPTDPFWGYEQITLEDAELLFIQSILQIITWMKKNIFVQINQSQIDALVSLIYNWGSENFSKSNGFKHLNKGNFELAKFHFFDSKLGVVKVKGKICKGLQRRRQIEHKIWDNKYDF